MLRYSLTLFALGILALALLPERTPAIGEADPLDPAALRERGIEVLARGPVHEAFAEPFTGKPQATPVIPNQPPKGVDEIPPDERPAGDDVQWIPGYWQWDDERNDFIWVSGFWRNPPPGRRWVPGHWQQAGEGWQYVPGLWADANQNDMNYLPQPPEALENGPSVPAPAEDYQYVPGTWLYQDSNFAWRPGFWMQGRPGWVWNPACYRWSPSGYLFNDGFWDYPPEDRGILCAPVWFDRPLFRAHGYNYCSNYFWRPGLLLSSLFVRQNYGCYYYGDYYGANYGRNFQPWFGVRLGGWGCDPFWNYGRWNNRNNPNWARNIHDRHNARVRGDHPRPPRNLNEQNTIVNNIQNINVKGKNNEVNAAIVNQIAKNGKNSTIDQVSVLGQINRGGKDGKLDGPRFEKLSAQDRDNFKQSGQELQRVGLERGRREGELAKNKGPIQGKTPRIELPVISKSGGKGGDKIANRPNVPPTPQNDARLANRPGIGKLPGQGPPPRIGDAPKDSSARIQPNDGSKNGGPARFEPKNDKPGNSAKFEPKNDNRPRLDAPKGNNAPKGNASNAVLERARMDARKMLNLPAKSANPSAKSGPPAQLGNPANRITNNQPKAPAAAPRINPSPGPKVGAANPPRLTSPSNAGKAPAKAPNFSKAPAQNNVPRFTAPSPQARPSAPIARPITPQARPSAPAARSFTPQARPSAPAARSFTPQARPSAPAARSFTPQARPSAPAMRSAPTRSAPAMRSAPARSAPARSAPAMRSAPARSSGPASRGGGGGGNRGGGGGRKR